tara:strand:+ start:10492 stop:11067 length:576 start_codon:yes stop_codon:yes gene_type:complete
MSKLRLSQYPTKGTITIADGEELQVNVAGTFCRVRSADQDFLIHFDNGSSAHVGLNDALNFDKEQAFNNLMIVNDSGAALTFQLDIGYGSVETNSLAINGTVKTAGGAARAHDVDTVGVAAVQLMAQNNSRTGWFIYNNGTAPIFVGSDNTITAANGTPIPVGGGMGGDDTDEIWAISGTAGHDVRHWEAS